MATNSDTQQQVKDQPARAVRPAAGTKKATPWKKPMLEDVSGKVMAQPYIRFT